VVIGFAALSGFFGAFFPTGLDVRRRLSLVIFTKCALLAGDELTGFDVSRLWDVPGFGGKLCNTFAA
jgi:hypothetical protein